MALDRNALVGAIERRKRAKNGQQQMQKMNGQRNRVFKPEDNTQATDNMPTVKRRPVTPLPRPQQRPEVPTDNMPRPRTRPATDNMPVIKQRQPTPMPQPRQRVVAPETSAQNRSSQNALMAKKLDAVRKGGLGTRMGG